MPKKDLPETDLSEEEQDKDNSTVEEAPKIQVHHANWVLGVTVVLLYAFFVSAVFAGFASYIYRAEWTASLATNPTGPQTVEEVLFSVNAAEAVRESFAAARNAEREAQIARDVADRDLRNAIKKMELAPQELPKLFNSLQNVATSLELEKPEMQQNSVFDVELSSADQFVNQFKERVLELPDGSFKANLASTLEALSEKVVTFRMTQENLLLKRQGFERLDIAFKAANERTKTLSLQMDAINQQAAVHATAQARLNALQGITTFFGSIFVGLVKFPTIFLTLIVTIAAGGLGTVVSYTRNRQGNEGFQDSLSRLFVSVGEGIAAAIGVFLLAGAGMLALTQGGAGSSDIELSPYTVAFVAFLSGFMAEDAFSAIQEAGKRLFQKRDVEDKPFNGDVQVE